MASNNGHEPAFSVAEVVGISTAAAVALGGVIIALGRTQANSSQSQIKSLQDLPVRDEVARRAVRGRELAMSAAESASRRYPDAREFATERMDRTAEAARMYGADVAALAETGLERAKQQSKVLSHKLQESVIPAVVAGAERARQNVEKQAKNTDTDELLAKSRHYADEAAEQLRHAGEVVAKTFQKDVLPAVAPVVKDASGAAEDVIEKLRDRAEHSKGRGSSIPGSKAVASGKESAQHALHSTSKAATDSVSALLWILISSAVVYLVLLSPERREQLKNAAFDVFEQVRLLVGDFKGYETEF